MSSEITDPSIPSPAAPSAPAGWHPDPHGRYTQRYWDGQRWTEHVMDGATQTTDQANAVNVASLRPARQPWPIVAAVAMFLGAIGPWAKVSVLGTTVTASGFDRDGIIVLIAAVPVLIGALVRSRGWLILAVIGAVISTITAVYDYFDIAGIQFVTVEWGLWLSLIASIAATLTIAIMLRRPREV